LKKSYASIKGYALLIAARPLEGIETAPS